MCDFFGGGQYGRGWPNVLMGRFRWSRGRCALGGVLDLAVCNLRGVFVGGCVSCVSWLGSDPCCFWGGLVCIVVCCDVFDNFGVFRSG